ncbi:MAG: hypothetical protein ACREDF_05525, partial [Thermoplasmata archaeon]
MISPLHAVPFALLGVLEAWVLIDLLSIGDRRWAAGLGLLWIANIALLAVSVAFRWRVARWAGYVGLGGAHVVMHAFILGIQLLPSLAFVSLLIAHVELRILAERFAPLFAATITRAERRKIGSALMRASLRLSIALVLSIVVPLLTANLSAAGFVPATTIPTAFLLAGALVAVVVLLALLPA